MLLNIVTASASLFTARSNLTSWLQLTSSPSFSLDSLPHPLLLHSLVAYNNTLSHLIEASATQSSFHYLEPGGFYLSIRECSIPLLQEKSVVELFLHHLHFLSRRTTEEEEEEEREPEIPFEGIEALYAEERRERFPLRESVWHKQSWERYIGMRQRYSDYLLERKRQDRGSRFELLVGWFETEQKEFWRLPDEQSTEGRRGSCCELLFC
jgi:hypothetical protein